MIPRQVAIVSQTSNIDIRELCIVSAALERQATRDFGPIWGIAPTVDPFVDLSDVPAGYWPIVIRDDIKAPGAAGFHEDTQGHPFSLVQYSSTWSLTCSHECLEMLADPFGSRLVPGDAPEAAGGARVEYLLEVCDPCEDVGFAYTVNKVLVSDFYTPRFFDPTTGPVRYDFTGSIHTPRTVLNNGYISWYNPADDHWHQLTCFGGVELLKDLGKLSRRDGSPRAQIDAATTVEQLVDGADADPGVASRRAETQNALTDRAKRLQREIDDIAGA